VLAAVSSTASAGLQKEMHAVINGLDSRRWFLAHVPTNAQQPHLVNAGAQVSRLSVQSGSLRQLLQEASSGFESRPQL